MKGLKKLALVSAIAAVSAGAQAELKALDDSAMGELTGQAGLTIDIETKWSIAEFMYKDAGSILITGIEMGGVQDADAAAIGALTDGSGNAIGTGSYLDNIRMTIDVAGAGVTTAGSLGTVPFVSADNTFDYGFSKISSLSAWHVFAQGNTDAGLQAAAVSGFDSTTTTFGDRKKTYGDGDLVIHWSFNDVHAAGGGLQAYKDGTGWTSGGMTGSLATVSYADARNVATRAVDFNFQIDAIGLADSSYVEGTNVSYDVNGDLNEWESSAFTTGIDADTSDTILISQLDIKGYYGPMDLHIENNGNGFGGNTGSGDADSKIYWDSYFRIEDLDIYIDIAGLLLEDVTINNDRGDLTGLNSIVLLDGSGNVVTDGSGNPVFVNSGSFGFAHSKRTIYAIKDAVVQLNSLAGAGGSGNPADFVDGLALNTEFKGDISIGALKFGDTDQSIGEIHLTDVYSDTRWTISAH